MSQVLWILSRLNPRSLLDILLVALLFYGLLSLLQGTRAVPLLRGLILVLLFILVIRSVLRLPTMAWLLDSAVPALIVTIPVLFQPELRRALENLGQSGIWIRRPWSKSGAQQMHQTIERIADACMEMSRQRIGALIIMERSVSLDEYASLGTLLEARLSSELLLNLFYPKSPLHDGAVLVRKARILAAGCVLPLSEDVLDSYQYGMRHRAAIGISEQTDAVSVVVSEETGAIAVAQRGRIVRWLDRNKLVGLLQALFRLDQVRERPGRKGQ
ncbi:MAG: diadenylate cyclase CdaA [Chloroflexia bacterium]|nr:diadenylate cyclase CdaA [Chloroflexia bacterium]